MALALSSSTNQLVISSVPVNSETVSKAPCVSIELTIPCSCPAICCHPVASGSLVFAILVVFLVLNNNESVRPRTLDMST